MNWRTRNKSSTIGSNLILPTCPRLIRAATQANPSFVISFLSSFNHLCPKNKEDDEDGSQRRLAETPTVELRHPACSCLIGNYFSQWSICSFLSFRIEFVRHAIGVRGGKWLIEIRRCGCPNPIGKLGFELVFRCRANELLARRVRREIPLARNRKAITLLSIRVILRDLVKSVG